MINRINQESKVDSRHEHTAFETQPLAFKIEVFFEKTIFLEKKTNVDLQGPRRL